MHFMTQIWILSTVNIQNLDFKLIKQRIIKYYYQTFIFKF